MGRHGVAMADDRTTAPSSTQLTEDVPVVAAGTTLSTTESAALARELEALRSRHRSELAGSGAAGLGATVRVLGDDGRECEYELVGRRNPDSAGTRSRPPRRWERR